MAQGNKLKIKKKSKPSMQKRKGVPVEEKDRERLETTRAYKKTMKKAQKKIYTSIEKSIINKAKHKRENFELL